MFKSILPYKRNNNKPIYIRKYNGNAINITRSGISFNPLELYNPVSLNPIANDKTVQQGDMFGVFGDTMTVEYDLGTKVAGSTVECPCKVFRGTTTNIATLTPANILAETELMQGQYDNVKFQDNVSVTQAHSVNGGYDYFGIEVDLTPLANILGGNSALKSALKGINVDVWAMGSGSNGGVSANGVKVKTWMNTDWAKSTAYDGSDWYASMVTGNNASSITKSSIVSTSVNNALTSSNKLYILIASQYASDGTIASSVSLDYLKVKVDLARVVDTVSPISVNLPKYFAFVLRGFSPAWDNTDSKNYRVSFSVYKNSSNFIELFRANNNTWSFYKYIGGVSASATITIPTLLKYQVVNVVVGQNSSGMFMYILLNNGTVLKATNTDTRLLDNTFKNLYIGSENNNYIADMFADSFTLVDLEKIGKIKFSRKNLFDKNSIKSGYYIENTGLEAGNASWSISNYIPVKPSTSYSYSGLSVVGSAPYSVYYDINKNFISSFKQQLGNNTIATPPNAYYVRFSLSVPATNDANTFQLEEGTVVTTYEPYVLQDGFTDNEAQSILDGSDRYYVTSTTDFAGKIKGSVVENPNIIKVIPSGSGTSLKAPTDVNFTEVSQGTGYDTCKTLDGTYTSSSRTINGDIAQQLFSFDVIAHLERKYGTLPCPQDLASKVAWVKANISNNTAFKWVGYGSCPSGNFAQLYVWSSAGNTWMTSANKTTSANTPTSITYTLGSHWTSVNVGDSIDNNGFIHLLAFTSASNGTIPSTIYTDYVSLDVVAKIVPVNPYLPNSELFDINAVSLHANASRNNGVITLNATAGYQASSIIIPVLPNNKYSISANIVGTNGYIDIREYYNNISLKSATLTGGSSNILIASANNATFITSNNTNKVKISISNDANTQACSFSNISLKRKD